MRNIEPLSVTALIFSLCACGTPVEAQSIDEALAAVHVALTGRWEGHIEGVQPNTGDAFSEPDIFTFTTIGAGDLGAAWWSDASLILYEYLGDGVYHARTYGPNGPGFEEDLVLSVPEPIDAEGRGTWIVAGWGTSPDGTEYEIREVFSIAGAELSMVAEDRPRDQETAPYRVFAEASYRRAAPQ